MKKLLAIFFLFLSVWSSAQTIAIKGGVAFTTFSASPKVYSYPGVIQAVNRGYSLKTGFVFGGYVDFSLNQNLFVRPGLEFVLKGSAYKGTFVYNGTSTSFDSKVNYPAVDFPVDLIYKIKMKGDQHIVFVAGVLPGFLFEGGFKKWDLGVNVLAGYEFPSGLTFGLNYNHGILNAAGEYSEYETLLNRT